MVENWIDLGIKIKVENKFKPKIVQPFLLNAWKYVGHDNTEIDIY